MRRKNSTLILLINSSYFLALLSAHVHVNHTRIIFMGKLRYFNEIIIHRETYHSMILTTFTYFTRAKQLDKQVHTQ